MSTFKTSIVITMLSIKHVAILLAIIACTLALKCYTGNASGKDHPTTTQDCPSGAKYCVAATVQGSADMHSHGCDTGVLCKKEGCETANLITSCCCTTDLCNVGITSSGSKLIPALFSLLLVTIVKFIVY
ncbi:unnamed protein product [Cylicocyclus nassatus]|uniref:Snake toxin/toxin-like domain-containing protein n=1 Tax=Cylicocyclus nassatus TaxID=53992 RepID=A0AA36M542_CYLNA|nr:unnamed protein product [Cylicocyclus nassatus]